MFAYTSFLFSGELLSSNEDERDGGDAAGEGLQVQPSQSMVEVHDVETITFSNLEAMIPPAPERAPQSPAYDEIATPESVEEDVSTRGMPWGYMLSVFVLMAVGGFLLWHFVGLPNPAPSQAVSSPSKRTADVATEATQQVDPVPEAEGELTVGELVLKSNGKKGRKRRLRVEGLIDNATNRIQAGIDFEVSVLHEGLPIHRSRQRCCRRVGETSEASSTLEPNESQPFSFELPPLDYGIKALRVEARILFSDSKMVGP